MANIGTKLNTFLFGKKLGQDEFGNKYFTNSKGKRWVIYQGLDEASKVPAEWHRWLHKTTDELPVDVKKHSWEQQHLPNLTGTVHSYAPKGHISRGGKRSKTTGDYTAWKPE